MKDLSRLYLHKLGPQEAARLAEFRRRLPALCQRVKAESAKAAACEQLMFWGVDVLQQSDSTDIILLKHLRAERGQVDSAAERLVRTLIFREEMGINQLRDMTFQEVSQLHAAASVGFMGGRDVLGRPVAVALPPSGGQEQEVFFNDTDGFVRLNFWLKEQAFKRIKFEPGAPEDMCQVVDLRAARMGPPPKCVQEGSKVFQKHCPESNGINVFINVNPLLVTVFKLCRRFVDQRTYDRIRILGPDDHMAIFQHVPPESLPVAVGGLYREPPGRCSGAARVVEVRAGTTEEVSVVELPAAAPLAWELRVCSQAVAYDVLFAPASGGRKVVLSSRGATDPLQAATGLVAGEWDAPEAGTLICRFSVESARLGAKAKARICLCRAETY